MNGTLLKIVQNRENCSLKERKVADAILSDPSGLLTRTITEYAEYIGTSPSTVTRFCHRMELSGYPELRLLIAKDNNSPNFNIGSLSTQDEEDVPETTEKIIEDVIANAYSSIGQLNRLFVISNLEKAVSIISQTRHIILCGVGASGIVAKDFHQKLCRIGISSHYDDDFDLVKVQVTSYDERDTVIAFSYSGAKAEIKSILKIAKKKNVNIITVTKAGVNPIASLADVNLQVAPSEALVRNGATVSRLQMLLVVDVLYQMLLRNSPTFNTLMETWNNVSGEKDDK